MNLNKIINSISRMASEEKTSEDPVLESMITPQIKEKFDISPDSKAFTQGANAAVFENRRGNIVAFIWERWEHSKSICSEAMKSVGRNSKILPEIYDIEIIDLMRNKLTQEICVIEMEKLQILTFDERKIVRDFVDIAYPEDKKETMMMRGLKPPAILDDLILLKKRMKEENIGHTDLHGGNVAWGKDGDLKLIDWESITLQE